jgi:putative addiction module component (TIGR02574 family)
MARIRDVLAQALDLPAAQRARLAHEMIRSLDEVSPDDPAEVADAWGAELTRRAEELRSGSVKGVPWSTVKKDIDRALRAVGSRKRRARSRAR